MFSNVIKIWAKQSELSLLELDDYHLEHMQVYIFRNEQVRSWSHY